MQDYEKLGAFYLGKVYDPSAGRRLDDLLLYDSRDLVTHAVCVGMTGSGKTGLCIGLLEEAAIDAIPAIVIDPKGDLANLLLTFPNLTPEEFQPWVNPDDAQRKGVSVGDFAQQQAALWSKGLTEWHQDAARVRRLRQSADFNVYTPGSNAGIPLSIIKTLAPPPAAVRDDHELMRTTVASTATGLLALAGIQADPLRDREHILISALLTHAWTSGTQGESLDLATLIARVQTPPITRLGVMELETMFPAKDRFALAMALNNLVASPGFSAWTQGEPLDVASLLYSSNGKPRISVISIAHLNDAERMFFVAQLLNQTLAWVRTQSGTTSLRAILYMDEIAGYCPPTANPPSKQPLLTLMKQARAFGLGVVLATQNPVDLDYKGLANAGTWFIGRLQTERDKARVLDGLEGAATHAGAPFNRADVDRLLSSLRTRCFLMNNVHEDAPVVFETRWCLSYLRGPLTKDQIRSLTDARRAERPAPPPTPASTAAPAASSDSRGAGAPSPAIPAAARPILPPDVPQYFIPIRVARTQGAQLVYHPMLLGTAKVYFSDPKLNIDLHRPEALLTPIQAGPLAADWELAVACDISDSDLERDPAASYPADFAAVHADATKARSYEGWKRSFTEALLRTTRFELFRCDELGVTSTPGQTERDFRAAIAQTARERRDEAAEKLRAKYAPKLAALEDRARRAQQRTEVEREQASGSTFSSVLSFGSAIMGAFMGRKVVSAANLGRAATAARSVSRVSKERADIARAEENLDALRQQHADLEAACQADIDALTAQTDASTLEITPLVVKAKKTNIEVRAFVLAWAPHWSSAGADTPAW